MSSVPYTFANNTGNIPLSELDANFSNVKASVDFAFVAGQAAVATSALTVTGSAQSSITSVGTLTNLNVNGTISAGNVVADYFIGDGSQLTNLPSVSYGNANVESYLPTYTGNLAGALISVVGNATADYFIGDGSQLTNLPSLNYSNANVESYLPTYTGNLAGALISVVGNATAGNLLTAGILSATGNVRGSNINTSGLVTATGNVTGGNIVTSGNVNAGNVSVTNSGQGYITCDYRITSPTFFGNLQGNVNSTRVDSGNVSTIKLYISEIQNANLVSPGINSYYNPVFTETLEPIVELTGTLQFAPTLKYVPNYVRLTGNAQSAELSSTNIIQADSSGYTAFVNFPFLGEGSIIQFSVAGGNSVTLVGTATAATISQSFDGLTAPGTGYRYMLVSEPGTGYYWTKFV